MPRRALILLLLPFLGACAGPRLAPPVELAPTVISRGTEERPAISPDGLTVVFERDRRLMEAHFLGNRWSTPALTTFTRPGFDADPFFSPDGSTLIFSSTRTDGARAPDRTDLDLWSVRRSHDGKWGQAKRLIGINSEADDRWPAITDDDTIVFTSGRDDPAGTPARLYVSERRIDGTQHPATPLTLPGGDGQRHRCAWIAHDGNFMVLTIRDTNARARNPSDDIAVSYRTPDGWTPPRRLGPKDYVNTRSDEENPLVTPDGYDMVFGRDGYLFILPLDPMLTDNEAAALSTRERRR